MSRSDAAKLPQIAAWRSDTAETEGSLRPAVLIAFAGIVTLWPYTSVVAAGGWSFLAGLLIVVIAATGAIARRLLKGRARWVREWTTMIAQLVIAIAIVTAQVSPATALFGVVPTRDTLAVFGGLFAQGTEQIVHGTAPLDATAAMKALLGVGFAVLAILLDQLITHRAVVLAIVLVTVFGTLPMIIAFSATNVVWFVLLGVLALTLLRRGTRLDPLAPQRASTALTAMTGVAALAVALIVTPVLPVSATWLGSGSGIAVDASLRLGDDLRRPTPVEVMTLATTAETAPYLRLATLSTFDGDVWRPDRGERVPLSDGFGDDEWGEDIETKIQQTSIRVLRMSSSWLPLPYAATGIQGVQTGWRIMPQNRTVVSAEADASGRDYTVSSTRVLPTRQQIQAASAVDPDQRIPDDLPPVIAERAAEVTAGATNDYDRLIALQSWFRSTFAYSLETPVEEGFDGTGAEAIERFLEEQTGYCIHFAGAFALMAQTMGMPVRIVVGYLPGALTDQKRGDEFVYSVRSDQLHSWPEVHFEGIGWVAFEPTASLGVPTAFAAAATEPDGGTGTATPRPTTAPSSTPTAGPQIDRDQGGSSSSAAPLRRLDPAPVLLSVVGALLVIVLPALIRRVRRMVRRARAGRGDAMAAWIELRDTLVDLRLPLSDADSPRARAAALVRERGVDAVAMRRLTDAVEQQSYARSPGSAGDLAGPLRTVLQQVERSVDRRSRARALMLPRSLVAARGAGAPLLV